MNTENELFGEAHEQEENGLFGNEHRRQYNSQNVYLIKYGHHIDSGFLFELGTNDESISKIIISNAKRNNLPGVKEIIEIEFVDLDLLTVRYKYKDWSDEIDFGQLFLNKFLVIY
jgi:hypothetical protein